MRVLVVGGGIGGLTAAQAFLQRGHQVEVRELHAEFPVAGAGIVLGPNATAVLRELGLYEELEALGRPLRRFSITTRSGTPLSDVGLPGVPTLALARPDLHAVLARDVDVRFDSTVHDVQDELTRFDLVVGADGISSRLRDRVVERPPSRVYSGQTCWRALVPIVLEPVAYEMWGSGRRVGIVPLRDQTYVFLTDVVPPESPAMTTAEIRAHFADFEGLAPRVLDALPDRVLHHDLDELDGIAWGAPRTPLIGDAAHALTPNMGQGAAMAIEDAWTLAAQVSQLGIDEGFAAYVADRHQRVWQVKSQSARIGRVASWAPPLSWIRDLGMRLTPAAVAVRGARWVYENGPVSPH